jgi:hypothetical protein
MEINNTIMLIFVTIFRHPISSLINLLEVSPRQVLPTLLGLSIVLFDGQMSQY